MIEIFKTVRRIYEKQKDKWTPDKEEGFRECLKYFSIGIDKHEHLNLYVKIQELEQIIYKQSVQIACHKNNTIDNVRTENTNLQNVLAEKNKIIQAYKDFLKQEYLIQKFNDFNNKRINGKGTK